MVSNRPVLHLKSSTGCINPRCFSLSTSAPAQPRLVLNIASPSILHTLTSRSFHREHHYSYGCKALAYFDPALKHSSMKGSTSLRKSSGFELKTTCPVSNTSILDPS